MKVPVSWLKDYVDIPLTVEDLARLLTSLGLEVEAVHYVGLPRPADATRLDFKVSGLGWEPDKIVVAEVREVLPHPNADRLVLARVFDGEQEHQVVTGAPNLFAYKGQGPLTPPLKVAYAREGATLLDPYNPGQTLRLKRRKIRGIPSYSMVCSEKELGISDEHEGIIVLDPDAPTGTPLADYMGDAVLDIAITPNMARALGIIGVAREVAAALNLPLRLPDTAVVMEGPPIAGRAAVRITDPEANPRFAVGLIEDVTLGPSPYEIQRRLKLAGMRPINNIVDATNYVMLEWGEPLHAFDYDILVQRADGQAPTIITRRAQPGERLTTLDGETRDLPPYAVLVTDTAGPLSIAGVMGGAESEVRATTRRVLLEAAVWDPITIRRVSKALKLTTEAAYRYQRGVHPALVMPALQRALDLMRRWAGGVVAQGVVDVYPRPVRDTVNRIHPRDLSRLLGLELPAATIADLLRRLDFRVRLLDDGRLEVTTPPHRLDIGEGVVGLADLAEEVARLYGYDRIPATRLADELPPYIGLDRPQREAAIKDALVNLGLQEVITYRLTAPEREARATVSGQPRPDDAYVRLVNPIAHDRRVLRQSLLPNLLEVAERNARFVRRQALFEMGPVFLPRAEGLLPDEPQRLALLLTGPREAPFWADAAADDMDFFDLKGVLETLARVLHLPEPLRFEPGEHPSLHPGKTARVWLGTAEWGFVGELHPEVKARYDFGSAAVLVAELDACALRDALPDRYALQPVPQFPPVIEDLAFVVDEAVPAAEVEAAIRAGGGAYVRSVVLFDVYRGPSLPAGKKSLAYRLAYQAPDRTLSDKDAARIRKKIVKRVARAVGGTLRG